MTNVVLSRGCEGVYRRSGTEVRCVEFVPEGRAGGIAADVGLGVGGVSEEVEQRCCREKEFHGARAH